MAQKFNWSKIKTQNRGIKQGRESISGYYLDNSILERVLPITEQSEKQHKNSKITHRKTTVNKNNHLITCPHCKCYIKPQRLQKHIEKVHQSVPTIEQNVLIKEDFLQCPHCDTKFEKRKNFIRHIRNFHNDLLNEQDQSSFTIISVNCDHQFEIIELHWEPVNRFPDTNRYFICQSWTGSNKEFYCIRIPDGPPPVKIVIPLSRVSGYWAGYIEIGKNINKKNPFVNDTWEDIWYRREAVL